MKSDTLINKTLFHLLFNFTYALANGIVALHLKSWWFLNLSAYYFILTLTRFSVLQVKYKSRGDSKLELFAKKVTGILFLFLSLCLSGVVILSTTDNRGTDFHEIIIITIAAYTFTKITLAIIGLIKSGKHTSPISKTLKNISLADAFVSVYSLQRSMLVSFPGMKDWEIRNFNLATGAVVCLLIFLLGINLIGGRNVQMAKSKIVKANEKIAKTVVDSYKKVENAVVSGYTKVEDRFVDAYLTKDGETVEEAKERLKNNTK